MHVCAFVVVFVGIVELAVAGIGKCKYDFRFPQYLLLYSILTYTFQGWFFMIYSISQD